MKTTATNSVCLSLALICILAIFYSNCVNGAPAVAVASEAASPSEQIPRGDRTKRQWGYGGYGGGWGRPWGGYGGGWGRPWGGYGGYGMGGMGMMGMMSPWGMGFGR